MTRIATWTLATILVLACSTFAHADPIFSYAFDHSNYIIPVGGTVDVTVFLQETDSGPAGALSDGYLSATGLFGVGVLVDYSGQPAAVQHLTDVSPNPA